MDFHPLLETALDCTVITVVLKRADAFRGAVSISYGDASVLHLEDFTPNVNIDAFEFDSGFRIFESHLWLVSASAWTRSLPLYILGILAT